MTIVDKDVRPRACHSFATEMVHTPHVTLYLAPTDAHTN